MSGYALAEEGAPKIRESATSTSQAWDLRVSIELQERETVLDCCARNGVL